ncbi:uncharacterized protein CXorf66 homolog [Meriones unguiculatus]|uniref:uncharacterized protein CXorf66 homolog n=1 Tax=Meriones unguiculatus TaxID=10047 RepID=UPI00293E8A6B|nr:uncharacterized protein CXorf66 homolog [Meriones unguiculatus]
MKVHIYVLFLSIWTINCLDRNQTTESSSTTTTTSTTTTSRPSGSKMDDFRKRLLGFIIGIMIIAFTLTCFCLLHYNCIVEESHVPAGLNKENIAAISSWVSKVSAYQPEMITEDIPEAQPLLNSDQVSGPSCQEKPQTPNSAVKSIQPSSPQKSCASPDSQKSTIHSNTENTSTTCSVKKSNRQLDTKKSTKTSRFQKFRKSHLERSGKKQGLKKSQKLPPTCKLPSKVNLSSSEKQVIPRWLDILQSSATLSCPSLSHDQIGPTKTTKIKKTNQSRGHDLKRSVSRGVSSTPTPPKACGHYKEKCLVCSSPVCLPIGHSGMERKQAEIIHVSREMKPSPQPFYEIDYNYNEAKYENCSYLDMSNASMGTYDSEDSDAEIIIICGTSHDKDILDKDTLSY